MQYKQLKHEKSVTNLPPCTVDSWWATEKEV